MLALTAGPRSIKSGKEFDKFFPLTLLHTDPIVIRSGSVEDSVRVMAQVAENYKNDTTQISQQLRSADLNVTCKNIWSFIYSFIQYREDEQGVEQIRRPGRSWNDRSSGVDCDCMSVFASSILRNLNIPHYFRITKYTKAEFQHVYVIVPNNSSTPNGYFTIDGVIDGYDKEKQFTECKDFDMNGIPIQLLNGLGKVAVDPLYEYLLQLQQICTKAAEKQIPISKGIACCDAGDLLEYAISNWKTPADRAVALQNNVQLEEKNWPELSFWRTVWNFQQGNATVQDIYENTFTALPPANPALGGYTDPFWINFFSSAGSNTTTTPPASGGTTFNAPAKQFSAKETEICKANSGWISLEEKNCLRELLLSLEAYEQIGKELFQIVVKSAKITPFLKDGEYLYNLEIEYERSYQNSFFSVHVPESSANPVILPQPLTWDNMEVSFDDMEITFDQIEY